MDIIPLLCYEEKELQEIISVVYSLHGYPQRRTINKNEKIAEDKIKKNVAICESKLLEHGNAEIQILQALKWTLLPEEILHKIFDYAGPKKKSQYKRCIYVSRRTPRKRRVFDNTYNRLSKVCKNWRIALILYYRAICFKTSSLREPKVFGKIINWTKEHFPNVHKLEIGTFAPPPNQCISLGAVRNGAFSHISLGKNIVEYEHLLKFEEVIGVYTDDKPVSSYPLCRNTKSLSLKLEENSVSSRIVKSTNRVEIKKPIKASVLKLKRNLKLWHSYRDPSVKFLSCDIEEFIHLNKLSLCRLSVTLSVATLDILKNIKELHVKWLSKKDFLIIIKSCPNVTRLEIKNDHINNLQFLLLMKNLESGYLRTMCNVLTLSREVIMYLIERPLFIIDYEKSSKNWKVLREAISMHAKNI